MTSTLSFESIPKVAAAWLVCLITTIGTAKGDTMTSSDLLLIPEPKQSRFVFGGYELDKVATVKHYETLFAGKTAEEVVEFLKEQKLRVFYDSDPNKIGIMLERLVTFFYHRTAINFFFEDGVFKSAEVWASGVK